jgi:hypothetical protein
LKRLLEHGLSGIAQRILGRSEPRRDKYVLDDAYDANFFLFNLADSRPQAEWLAPKLTKALGIKRMIDIGCATGHWVDAFLRCGVDARGIEGAHVAARHLVCPADRVTFADLREPLDEPAQDVDFVLSIEVAEHIEAKYVNTFITNITQYKPHLIFITSAPPGQGGRFHVNEQPREYWIERFEKCGYTEDLTIWQMVSSFVDEGRLLKQVPPIMQRDDIKHTGVWIPEWMPKNLMVFTN